MRKSYELSDPTSCWNKALLSELLFVALGRDRAVPATLRFWCRERCALHLNQAKDAQIITTMNLADEMEEQFEFVRRQLQHNEARRAMDEVSYPSTTTVRWDLIGTWKGVDADASLLHQKDLNQDKFDSMIGQLDRVLSLLGYAARSGTLDEPNEQTLKHHAEDMIAAGNLILKKLGIAVEGSSQPAASPEMLLKTQQAAEAETPVYHIWQQGDVEYRICPAGHASSTNLSNSVKATRATAIYCGECRLGYSLSHVLVRGTPERTCSHASRSFIEGVLHCGDCGAVQSGPGQPWVVK